MPDMKTSAESAHLHCNGCATDLLPNEHSTAVIQRLDRLIIFEDESTVRVGDINIRLLVGLEHTSNNQVNSH